MVDRQGRSHGGCLGVPGATKLYRNSDLRAVLDELAQTPATIDDIRRVVVDRFGLDQAPSRSAVGRYVRRVRVTLGINFLRVRSALPARCPS